MHIITHFFTLQVFLNIYLLISSVCSHHHYIKIDLPISAYSSAHLPIYSLIHNYIYIYTLCIYYVHQYISQSIHQSINPPINLSLSLPLSLSLSPSLSLSMCISFPSRPSSKLSNASSSPPPSLRRCRSWHAAPHRINRCPTWPGFQWENHGTIKATSSINGPKKAGKINYRLKSSSSQNKVLLGINQYSWGKVY